MAPVASNRITKPSTSTGRPRGRPSNTTTIDVSSDSGGGSDRDMGDEDDRRGRKGKQSRSNRRAPVVVDDEDDKEEEDDSDDPFATQQSDKDKRRQDRRRKRRPDDVEDDDDDEEEEEAAESVPPALVARMLHELFRAQEQQHAAGSRSALPPNKMTREAGFLAARYVDLFVRETVARAGVEAEVVGRGRGAFLEVEDLEKVIPQLMLDF